MPKNGTTEGDQLVRSLGGDVEACAFLGACAGRRAVGDTACSVSDERSCLRRANHQDVVMAFHLAGDKY